MGNNQSEIERQKKAFLHCLFSSAESHGVIPDIGIDSSLVKYSGLNSASELENSINQTLNDIHSRFPDYLQNLGSALSAFKHVPTAVGLGAVVVSIALELILRTLDEEGESKDSTLGMVRRVFAEEKASGVRDLMEEYMKRLRMYLHQPTRALEETERLEKQLSEQLTRLKNSMLHDHQMSSRSMKHWTNGAAFHLLMLIHEVRLKMQNTTEDQTQLQVHLASIKTVLDGYQYDLEELLQKYKTYKKSTTSPVVVITGFRRALFRHWLVKDMELEKETPYVDLSNQQPVYISSDEYVEYMFDNWTQLKELRSYFSDLKENLNDLIIQNDEFNIEKFLPVEYNQSK